MNLFFETAQQARVFLVLLPVGMLLAACLDMTSYARVGRPFFDVLVLLGCSLSIVAFLALLKDDGIRGYHLLAVFSGAVIYLCGIGRLFRCIRRKLQKWQSSRAERHVKAGAK